jgi:hypothetical protein
MKKPLLFLIFFPFYIFSQTLPRPALWFKVVENSFVGKDTSNISILLDWRGDLSLLSADKINGYPALNIANDSVSGYFLLSTDVLKNRQNALLLIAYQPYKDPFVEYNSRNLPEYGLWTLLKDDTTRLTSIHYGTNKSNFRYQYQDYPGAIITSNLVSFKTHIANLLGDTLNIESSDDTLLLCYADSLFLRGKLAEYIIINEPLTDNFRQVWQSYLALKYGSTLFRGNYLNSAGDTLWYYVKNEDFSDGVGGICRDDGLLLNQNFSQISGDSLLVSLHDVDIQSQTSQVRFQNGDYIFWGHDNGFPEISNAIFPVGIENFNLFSRIWEIRPYTNLPYLLDFQINTSNSQNLKLFVSSTPNFYTFETQIFEHQSIYNQKVKFSNLIFKDSVSYFTFGYNVNDLNNQNYNSHSGDNQQNSSFSDIYSVFTEADWQPNPVRENLYISYKLTRSATVWFTVHSNGGIPLCQTSPQNLQSGYNQTIIPMSMLPTGTYSVYVHVDDMVLIQIIIKI